MPEVIEMCLMTNDDVPVSQRLPRPSEEQPPRRAKLAVLLWPSVWPDVLGDPANKEGVPKTPGKLHIRVLDKGNIPDRGQENTAVADSRNTCVENGSKHIPVKTPEGT